MNGVTKSVILALAVSALPFAAQAADKASSGKDWPSFKKIDADNSGAVSMDEARTVNGLAENFAPYDKNGDGQLSKSEYEAAKKAQKSGKSSSGDTSSRSSGGASSSGSSSGSTGGSAGSSGASGSDAGSSSGSR